MISVLYRKTLRLPQGMLRGQVHAAEKPTHPQLNERAGVRLGRFGSTYRSGRSRKVKKPAARREAEEDWS
jgi:hypothetical protein